MAEMMIDLSLNVDDLERERAIRLVMRKGRTYKIGGGKHVSLHVYSTSKTDMDLLVRFFGGNYYDHHQGFQWHVARGESLQKVAESLLAFGEEFSPQARKRLQLVLIRRAELAATAAAAATDTAGSGAIASDDASS